MPDEDRMLKFKNQNHSIRVPFVVYADYEAFTKSISGCAPNSGDNFTNKS